MIPSVTIKARHYDAHWCAAQIEAPTPGPEPAGGVIMWILPPEIPRAGLPVAVVDFSPCRQALYKAGGCPLRQC